MHTRSDSYDGSNPVNSIASLPEIVESRDAEFRDLFSRIYSVRVCEGKLVLPGAIKEWAENRFGNCETQKIVRVTNRLSGESTLFNELRARRPLDAKSEVSLDVEDCVFCDPENRTPSDTFGRVEGKYCITASNIAKYDCMHAVIVFREHNPLVSSQEVIEDIFLVARTWFERANDHDRKYRYPFFMWNCLWRAGASIIHGHAQALISQDMYPKPEQLLRLRRQYAEEYNSEYLDDVYRIHEELGLGFEVDCGCGGCGDCRDNNNDGKVRVMAYLTPVKEKEVVMVADDLVKLAKPLASVLNCYYSLGVMSFNVAAYMPPVGEKDLVFLRVVDRGNMGTKTADIGGMELYAGISVVSSDPFSLARELAGFL